MERAAKGYGIAFGCVATLFFMRCLDMAMAPWSPLCSVVIARSGTPQAVRITTRSQCQRTILKSSRDPAALRVKLSL